MSARMYEIEDGIPLPPHTRREIRYPFPELEVGQSFLVPWPDGRQPQSFANQISSRATQWGRRLGRVFRTRSSREGVRVWRVA